MATIEYQEYPELAKEIRKHIDSNKPVSPYGRTGDMPVVYYIPEWMQRDTSSVKLGY